MKGGKPRRFNPQWFESYDWLEYSVKVDRVFCLPCYLFNDHVRTQVGGDAFIFKGFGGWNKMQERLKAHIGEVGSVHSKAIKNYDALIFSFCDKHDIEKLNMTESYINPKNRRQKIGITYEHYYCFDCFNVIVDIQLEEFDDRFNEVNFELLICMDALDSHDSFVAFDSLQLMMLVDFYPSDFSSTERMALEHELIMYIDNVKDDKRFAYLNGISDFARLMVQTRKHLSYPLIYRLLKLALVLSVVTANVERCFSAMKLVNSDLRNRIGDVFLSDCLVSATEKEALANVSNDDVINRFQKMKTRREQL